MFLNATYLVKGLMDEHKRIATFHKMKVTGPRSAELDDTTQPLLEVTPTAKAIAQTEHQMVAALKNVVRKVAKPKTRRGTKRKAVWPSTSLAVYNSCMQRLQALKSHFEQSYNPLVQLLSRQLQPATTAPPAATHPPAVAAPPLPVEADSGQEADAAQVCELLPAQYHSKYNMLNKYLKANPGTIRASPSGAAVINGAELTGSSYVDIMHSLSMWRKDPGSMPRGASAAIGALQSIGVPSTLLSSSAARKLYQDAQEAEETYESPDEEKPTDLASSSGRSTKAQGQEGKGLASPWPGRAIRVLHLHHKRRRQ
jgi:hypothetical protein